jgi:hypothetical protein
MRNKIRNWFPSPPSIEQQALQGAIRYFESTTGECAVHNMCRVLASGRGHFVVRMAWRWGGIPPRRTWYHISGDGVVPPVELQFAKVEELGEKPWR